MVILNIAVLIVFAITQILVLPKREYIYFFNILLKIVKMTVEQNPCGGISTRYQRIKKNYPMVILNILVLIVFKCVAKMRPVTGARCSMSLPDQG